MNLFKMGHIHHFVGEMTRFFWSNDLPDVLFIFLATASRPTFHTNGFVRTCVIWLSSFIHAVKASISISQKVFISFCVVFNFL